MKKEKEQIELKPLKRQQIKLKVNGITPLLEEKMDMEVVERYNKKKGKKITEKDTILEEDKVENKIHYTKEGNVGFPVMGFKKGMVEIAPYLNLEKKRVRTSVQILGNIIPINYKKKDINISYGKTSGMKKSPRKIIRPEFQDWGCELNILYNANVISAEEIINLVNYAGFHMGIGGWRPECNGTYGQYEVEVSK